MSGDVTLKPRKRTEIAVRFRLRTTQRMLERPVMLQIRLTVEGETMNDYSAGIQVRPDQWNQRSQKVDGRGKLAAALNEKLAEIELAHREIHRELKRVHSRGLGPYPTAKMVAKEFRLPNSTINTVDSCFGQYLNFLESLEGTDSEKAEKTMQRLYKAREHLRAFCGMKKPRHRGIKVADKSPALMDLTTNWGKEFYAWLQKIDPATKKPRMKAESAGKYLQTVRAAVDHAVDEGLLTINKLDRFRPRRGKNKPVYFLEPDHLDRLMGLQLQGDMGVTVWWAKLMCLTGLDYVDAVRYARNRAEYNATSETGKPKISITRSKQPRNECEIYRLPEVDALFDEYPTGPRAHQLTDLNRNLKVIAEGIGFPASKPFTSKICRKTAGAHFLRMGFLIASVSKMLGHSSIRTTEEHYVKVQASHVDQDIDRVGRYAEIRPINPVAERDLFRRAG